MTLYDTSKAYLIMSRFIFDECTYHNIRILYWMILFSAFWKSQWFLILFRTVITLLCFVLRHQFFFSKLWMRIKKNREFLSSSIWFYKHFLFSLFLSLHFLISWSEIYNFLILLRLLDYVQLWEFCWDSLSSIVI